MTPVLNTPPEVIRGFNSLVFHFLWKDKVTRCFSYAPYDLGGLKMINYENMVKAMRLSWLKRISDENCTGFWKSYLDHSLGSYVGLFLFNCYYDPNKLNISSVFYYELLLWWSELREAVDLDNEYKYIIWNNKEIKIEGKSVFYSHFVKGIKYTKDLLSDRTNIDSFNTVKGKTLIKSNFLVWTGLRHVVPSNLHVNIPDFKAVFDLNNYKCRDYYGYLIKKTYERPRKWSKIGEEFDLIDDLISKAYLLPIRVASKPYLRSFQYKVLNSISYTNDILYKIGFVSDPNCCFCKRNEATANHLFFSCSFSHLFWSEVTDKILKKLSSCECLLLRDVLFPKRERVFHRGIQTPRNK